MRPTTPFHGRAGLVVIVCSMLTMATAQVAPPTKARNLPQPDHSGALEQLDEVIAVQRRSVFDPVTPKTRIPAYPNSEQIKSEEVEIERARKLLFSDDNAATNNAPSNFPKVPDALPNQIDIEALAKRYQNKAQAAVRADDLVVFASFSMPTESLRTLVISVTKLGGSVALRGFKNDSYRQTLQAIAALGVPSASISVNPKAFDQYQITAVPTFVLTKRSAQEALDANGCSLAESFVAISGDVSLAYALRQIAERPSAQSPKPLQATTPTWSALAERYLRQMGTPTPEVAK